MTINRITDTPIQMKVYGSRGLRPTNLIKKVLVRQPDGTLWAQIGVANGYPSLFKSTDNGFSWDEVDDENQVDVDRYLAGTGVDGPIYGVIIDEQWDNLDIYMASYDSVGVQYDINRIRHILSSDLSAAPTNTAIDTTGNVHEGVFNVVHNHDEAIVSYAHNNLLSVRKCSPRTTSVAAEVQDDTGDCWNVHSSCITEDGKVWFLISHQPINNIVAFIEFDLLAGTFGAPVTILDLGDTDHEMRDPAIGYDGFGSICTIWTNLDTTDESYTIQYATSTDSGATWDQVTLTPTAGHGDYLDSIYSKGAGKTNLIGGSQGGFLLSYVEDNSSAIPKTYIRQLTFGGGVFTLGAEKEIATSEGAGEAVVGLEFFRPPAAQLLDITDPGLVRVAYTVGEGNSTTDLDTVPVNIGQELLSASAYPSSLSSEASGHSLDDADSVSLRVLVDIHAGPNSNVDFYAAGFTGTNTDRFEAAFKKLGTTIRLLKFEALSDNYLSDRSAYGAPTEYSSLAVLTPRSYFFPTPNLSSSDTDDFVERDVRKIHLPPDFPLLRTFVVNKGGYLKRTVWTCEFDGNEYELSQVIPRFLSQQICYYEANAYVVGPSRDPFSRTILPSET